MISSRGPGRGPDRHPTRHPGDELLMEYASGSLAEAPALVIATHLALCPACRRTVSEYEALGGALLEDLPPTTLSEDCLASILSRLDEPTSQDAAPQDATPHDAAPRGAGCADRAGAPVLPEPLRSYAGGDVDELAWKPADPGVEEIDLGVGTGGTCTRLMRIRAGAVMARHSHRGVELMMVLKGGITEFHAGASGHFLRGDVAFAEAGTVHGPVADRGEDCVCIVVTDAPIRVVTPFPRF
ncbi:MAG TPA: ChrR family anti-sigma-E factor [Arenibaculum sp.]|nr:ChrR family anti-sigma-E factor [Arenibaculum sp.]